LNSVIDDLTYAVIVVYCLGINRYYLHEAVTAVITVLLCDQKVY